jgi:hypothetical protein
MSNGNLALMPAAATTLHRDYTVTPSGVDAWRQCPLRAALAPKGEMSEALRRGQAIHDALRFDGRRTLAHQPRLAPEEVVLHICTDTTLLDSPDFLDHAVACVIGVRNFLEERRLTLVRAEQYVRSAYRDIGGAPGLRVRLSGRIDAVACTASGGMALIDFKTGRSIPSSPDLAALPSSFVYSYLGRCLRDQDRNVGTVCGSEIEILQVLPHLNQSTSACLPQEAMQTGALVVRQMVMDRDRGYYPAMPGEHCAYCAVKDDCPLRPQPAAWESEPF